MEVVLFHVLLHYINCPLGAAGRGSKVHKGCEIHSPFLIFHHMADCDRVKLGTASVLSTPVGTNFSLALPKTVNT